MSDLELDHADREHSELSASGTHRWWNCPGSVKASRGRPDTSSEAAREGTAMHELAQLCLTNGQDTIEYIGRTVAGFEMTDDLTEAVQVYIDHVRRNQADTLPDARWIEQRLSLDKMNPPAPMFGTADAVCFVTLGGILYVDDLKGGKRHRVEAAGNPQLKYYALLAMIALAENPRFKAMPVRKIVASIVQPRQPAAGRDPIRTVEIDPADLMDWAFTLMQRAEAAMSDDAPFEAGYWCKFCPVGGACHKQAEAALALAQIEFGAFIEADTAPTPVNPATLSPEQLGALLGRLEQVEVWIADARKLALSELAAGRHVPDWKLVETEGHAKWNDTAAAEGTLSLVYGVDPYSTPELVSPAVARGRIVDSAHAAALATWEAAGKPKGQKPTKKDIEAKTRVALKPLTYRPRGTALAPASDTRPAITGGGAEFPTLPDETATA